MADERAPEDPIGSPQSDDDNLGDVDPETPCPYLPGLMCRADAYHADALDPAMHEYLMGLGFRRSGHVVYRPRCRGCDGCKPLRVSASRLVVTRSLRRVVGRNRDVKLHIAPPIATSEKYDMFRRYLDDQHDDTMSRGYDSFVEFLYDSPTQTLEFSYLVGDSLVAVGIADRCPSGLSSVYAFFDPRERQRGLGTYSVLREIEYCRLRGLPYYYIGFWIAGCKTMEYKARFRPNEILQSAGCWVPFRGG